MTLEVVPLRLLNKLRGVQGYVKGLKEREPGYLYDNFAEFESLVQEMKALGTGDKEMAEIMLFLQADIDAARKRLEQPVRSPLEEVFYRHIVGINSYISETKQGNPNYIFDNVAEVEGLLFQLTELNTQDPDILAIMDRITRDIKKVIMSRNGAMAAEEYQGRLDALNIGIVEQQKTR